MPKTNRPTICICCQTRKIDRAASSTDLCERCYDEAGYVNEHYDGSHDDEPGANCPLCLTGSEDCIHKAKAHAHVGHDSSVQEPSTDRRLAANKNLPKRTAAQRRADRKARRAAASTNTEQPAPKKARRNKMIELGTPPVLPRKAASKRSEAASKPAAPKTTKHSADWLSRCTCGHQPATHTQDGDCHACPCNEFTPRDPSAKIFRTIPSADSLIH